MQALLPRPLANFLDGSSATPDGRWRFPYRFGGTVGRVTYRFRARLPAEGGYPFISGNSRVVEVVVRGS